MITTVRVCEYFCVYCYRMFLHLTYQPQWYSAQEDWFLLTSGRFECKPHFLLWFVWCSYLPCQWPCQLCYLEQEFLPKRKNTQYNNPNIHGNICLNILVSTCICTTPKYLKIKLGLGRIDWFFPLNFFSINKFTLKIACILPILSFQRKDYIIVP